MNILKEFVCYDLHAVRMALKSPKAALASAIATALNRFFIVDEKAIETSLFLHAKVRISGLHLKQQQIDLPHSVMVMEGTIEMIEFSWAWGYRNGGWVRDPTLTIRGPHVTAKLIPPRHDTAQKEPLEAIDEAIDDDRHKGKSGDQSMLGPFYGYLQKQVDSILDSLDFDVQDVLVNILLPNDNGRSTQLGLDRIRIFSLGRLMQNGCDDSTLNQTIGLEGFFARFLFEGLEYPLVDPFYFVGQAKYAGGRFVGFSNDLRVLGQAESDLSVFAGALQLSVVSKLGVMVMVPPEDAEDTESADISSKSKDEDLEPEQNLSFAINVGHFVLDVGTATIRGSACEYTMDRGRVDLSLDSFEVDGDVRVSGEKVKADLMGTIMLQFGSINRLFVPQVVELDRSLHDTKISWENGCAIVVLEAIYATLLSRTEPPVSNTSNSENGATSQGSSLPFALVLKIFSARFRDEDNRNEMIFEQFDFIWNPKSENKTDVAFSLVSYQNRLMLVKNAYFVGSLPDAGVNEIDDVEVAVEFVKVTAGKSTKDWLDAFAPRRKRSHSGLPVYKLPRVKVDPVKLEVTWKGPTTSLGGTKITVNAFSGRAKTNTNDLIVYYASACASRVPEFLSNAEVLGVNIVDTAQSVLGSYIPFSDLVVMGARDTVRKVIENGKKSRKADTSAATSPLDIFRGLVYSVDATSKQGASATGMEETSPNPVNLTVGAAVGTGMYVNKNKSKIGAAVLGGSAAVACGVIGGPLLAIPAGVATQAVAKKTFAAAGSLRRRLGRKQDDADGSDADD